MIEKIGAGLQKAALALWAAALLVVAAAIVGTRGLPPLVLYPVCAAALAGLWALYQGLRQREAALAKVYPWLLLGLLVGLPVIQILLGLRLEFDPIADLGRVFHGAENWVREGTFALDWDAEFYFYTYPHNLGLTGLLALLFGGVAALGGDHFFLAGLVLNSVLATAALLLTLDCLRRLAGYAAAVCGAALCLLFPPLYLAGAVFYTDVMSFVFPPLLLWLALVARDKAWRWRLPLYGLMALAAFVGYHIKATVLIMLIAIWLVELRHGRWAALAGQAAAVALVFVAGTLLWNQFLFDNYLDADLAEENKLPLATWLMIGVSPQDDEWGFDTVFYGGENAAERTEVAWREIRQRLAQRAGEPGGLPAFFLRKAGIALGSGTLGLGDFLDDNPSHQAALHDFILYDAPHYAAYDAYCTGLLLALWLLALYGAGQGLRRPDSPAARTPQPWLALLGLFVFLLAWEMRDRYFSNYFLMLVIAAVPALAGLPQTKAKQ